MKNLSNFTVILFTTYYFTKVSFLSACMGRNRNMEFVSQRTSRHQRHSLAGRPAHAPARRAGEVPHAYNVPGGAPVHQPGAAGPRQRALLAGPGSHLPRRT